MAFDWNEYLVLADALYKTGTEAAYRSAISRAYYAAFHPARVIYDNENGSFKTGEPSHEKVWNIFVTDMASSGESISDMGRTLKSVRVKADYWTDWKPGPKDVEKALKDARLLISAINEL